MKVKKSHVRLSIIIIMFVLGIILGRTVLNTNCLDASGLTENEIGVVDYVLQQVRDAKTRFDGLEITPEKFKVSIDQKSTEDYEPQLYDVLKTEWTLTDVESLIHIRNQEDATQKRNELIQYIWKGEFPYGAQPEIVETGGMDEAYSGIENLGDLNKIVVTMDYGVDSVAYHFKAKDRNNKLVIYCQGHKGDFYNGRKTIEKLVNEGYDVAAFSMPLMGKNNQPTIQMEGYGYIRLSDHNSFFFIETDSFSPIKFFMHPIAATINYLEQEYNYETIAMVGISGGGWTSTVYAAVDPRIDRIYPVASATPLYLQTNAFKSSIGDYEEINPELYKVASYLDIFILGSVGENRKHLKIINQYDSCCHNGIGHMTYKEIVEGKVSDVGEGKFEIFLDQSHNGHKISEEAMKVILKDLKNT